MLLDALGREGFGSLWPRFCFAPDSGAGDGGGGIAGEGDDVGDAGDGGGDDGDTVTMSRAELNELVSKQTKEQVGRSMQKWRKGLQKRAKEADQLEKERDDLQAKLEEQEKLLAAKGGGDEKETETRLEIQRGKFETRIKELQRQLDDAQNGYRSAVERTRTMHRDQLVSRALQKAGCVNEEVGRAWALQHVYHDPNAEEGEPEWRMQYNELDGSIDEVLQYCLPEELRPASQRTGGSGAPSSSPKRAAKQKALAEKKKELEKLRGIAMSGGRVTDRNKFEALRKEIALMERELTAAK